MLLNICQKKEYHDSNNLDVSLFHLWVPDISLYPGLFLLQTLCIIYLLLVSVAIHYIRSAISGNKRDDCYEWNREDEMKEIKFKAYDSETEEWYYSDKEYDDHWFEFKDGTLMCFGVAENPGTLYEPPYPESYECEDILQYSNKKDIHDIEIYQNDIIKWKGFEVKNGKQIRPVRIWQVTDDFYRLFQIENIIRDNGTPEIIGNMCENPELLENII